MSRASPGCKVGRIRRIERVIRFQDAVAIMSMKRAFSDTDSSYIDVVDRILDKGIVLDTWMCVSVGGIDLITIEAHLIVASIDTHVSHCPGGDGARGMAKRSSIFDPV
jgi:gas vesicle structural protein